MTQISEDRPFIKRMWPIVLLVAVIAILLMYFILKPKASLTEKQKLELAGENVSGVESGEDKEVRQLGVVKKAEAAMNPMDFSPNPELDNLMRSIMESGHILRDMGAIFESDQEFRIYGSILTEENSSDTYNISIYSNDHVQYQKGEPLMSRQIEFGDDDFDIKAYSESFKSDWKPGIYYYVITKNEDVNPIFIGSTFKHHK